jgi:protein-tyrosine-phosphatase
MQAPLDGFASQAVSDALLEEATHVFAMTSGHLAVLEDRFPGHSEKFYLACEFIDLPKKGIGADVPDPIGMGKRAYEEVAKVFEQAIPAIIAYIDGTQGKP